MNKIEYLPLGSVVRLKNGLQKLLIISRALHVKNGEKVVFFDYGGVLFPEGLTDDKMAYFNQDAIEQIYFEGYRNEEDQIMVDNINKYLNRFPNLEKGTPDLFGK